MDITGWTLLVLSNKFLIYAASAGAVGGMFALWLLYLHSAKLPGIRRYLYWASSLGIIGSASAFFVQVGSFAGQGWAGMFDRDIIAVLLQTSLAKATALRMSGFVLLVLACLLLTRQIVWKRVAYGSALLGIFCVAFSFSLLGHLHDQGVLARFAITLHILAVSLWIGSLYPLGLVSRGSDSGLIQQSMKRFGQLAAFIVAVLIICGSLMANILLEQPIHLLTTDYGRGLLLKVILVCALLLLAAGNKWWLVPNLSLPDMKKRLSFAITMEMVLAVLLLIITASLTTFTGP